MASGAKGTMENPYSMSEYKIYLKTKLVGRKLGRNIRPKYLYHKKENQEES